MYSKISLNIFFFLIFKISTTLYILREKFLLPLYLFISSQLHRDILLLTTLFFVKKHEKEIHRFFFFLAIKTFAIRKVEKRWFK